MNRLDDLRPIEVARGIHWVGFADFEAGFSNNPYLLVDGNEAVLFDPGPGHPFFRDLIINKITEIVPPVRIRHIVVHHQDPDLCGLIPFIEPLVHPDAVIIAHPRSGLFIPYYGSRKRILPVGDGDVLELASGRRIRFIHTPYVHFAGSMMSYDEWTHSLFSSDLFAVFDKNWSLYANESHKELMKNFINSYVGDKRSVMYAYSKLTGLDIKRILPQHGSIIDKDVRAYIDLLPETNPGVMVNELANKPGESALGILLAAGKKELGFWLKTGIPADTLDGLLDIALDSGPATVSMLFDAIARKSAELGVSNPLASNRVHVSGALRTTSGESLLSSMRSKLLKSQYSMLSGNETNIDLLIQRRLQAVKIEAIVMFVDIRGFTKWSEPLPPDEVVRTLNRELELVTRAIVSSGGRVNKYMGDGTLAYFPRGREREALKAGIKAIVSIKRAGLLQVGIGISSGDAIMGDLGEEERLDFTIIGKAVNFASRMCVYAKAGEIAMTEDFFDGLDSRLGPIISSFASFHRFIAKIKPDDPEIPGAGFSPLSKKG